MKHMDISRKKAVGIASFLRATKGKVRSRNGDIAVHYHENCKQEVSSND